MKSIVTKHGILLKKTKNSFENEGVFNPAVIQEGAIVHMYYRAVREGNFSTLGYCKLDGPLTVIERSEIPVFSPQESYEFKGTEDPRIVNQLIDDTVIPGKRRHKVMHRGRTNGLHSALMQTNTEASVGPLIANELKRNSLARHGPRPSTSAARLSASRYLSPTCAQHSSGACVTS